VFPATAAGVVLARPVGNMGGGRIQLGEKEKKTISFNKASLQKKLTKKQEDSKIESCTARAKCGGLLKGATFCNPGKREISKSTDHAKNNQGQNNRVNLPEKRAGGRGGRKDLRPKRPK